MRSKIKAHYAGFVPAYIPHPLPEAYHSDSTRTGSVGARYCTAHGSMYDEEALANPEGAKVLCFTGET